MDEKHIIKKSYIRMCICILTVLLLIILAAEFVVHKKTSSAFSLYKIEISRIENELLRNPDPASIRISDYKTIISVSTIDETDTSAYSSDEHYCIRKINNTLYKIEYEVSLSEERQSVYLASALIILVTFFAVIALMVIIYFVLIRTFNSISEYPAELAKGNLTIPLSESRNRYFGRFLWGLDMLREKLEDEKKKNLDLQKEKNVFLLSLSHDIKTPISAIKLYAAAIRKNLYKDSDKLQEVASKIDDNVNEIEGYVSRIVAASNDDFLDFTVREGEFYLSSAIGQIKEYYTDKLKSVGTVFTIDEYSDIIINGDGDRYVEVLQNIIENAIKYGDGEYIRITFSDEDNSRLVSVTNSGCDLSVDEIQHIFDSFYRGSNVGSRPGSGLGLYICKKLMNRMSGEIFAEKKDNDMIITTVLSKK